MELLKVIHVGSALISIIGFIIRAILMVIESPLLKQRVVKIIPHVVDTVLLGSAIALASGYGFNPFSTPWLLAKIIALLIYIAFGFIGLDSKFNKPVRLFSCVAAVVTFAYIVAVAVSKEPLLGLF